MRKHRMLPTAIIAALAAGPLAAHAQVTNEELLKRIEEQEQKILVLERKLEIQDESATSAREATPVVSAGPKGYSLKSADGKNQLRLRGTMHLDGRYLEGEDPGGVVDTFQATRVRPTIEGTFAEIYDFKFMPDFGQGRTVIQDAYVRRVSSPAPNSPSASSSRRSGSSACSRPMTCAGCNAAFRPALRQTAISDSSSAATWPGGVSRTRPPS